MQFLGQDIDFVTTATKKGPKPEKFLSSFVSNKPCV